MVAPDPLDLALSLQKFTLLHGFGDPALGADS